MDAKKTVSYRGIIRNSLHEPSNNPGETYNYDEFFPSDKIDIESLETDIIALPISVKQLYSCLKPNKEEN